MHLVFIDRITPRLEIARIEVFEHGAFKTTTIYNVIAGDFDPADFTNHYRLTLDIEPAPPEGAYFTNIYPIHKFTSFDQAYLYAYNYADTMIRNEVTRMVEWIEALNRFEEKYSVPI